MNERIATWPPATLLSVLMSLALMAMTLLRAAPLHVAQVETLPTPAHALHGSVGHRDHVSPYAEANRRRAALGSASHGDALSHRAGNGQSRRLSGGSN